MGSDTVALEYEDDCFAMELHSKEPNVTDGTLAWVDSACTRCTHSTALRQRLPVSMHETSRTQCGVLGHTAALSFKSAFVE